MRRCATNIFDHGKSRSILFDFSTKIAKTFVKLFGVQNFFDVAVVGVDVVPVVDVIVVDVVDDIRSLTAVSSLDQD